MSHYYTDVSITVIDLMLTSASRFPLPVREQHFILRFKAYKEDIASISGFKSF